MRRSLAALAAAALLLSSVGGTAGAEPQASESGAPVVGPNPWTTPPPTPEPSADPSPTASAPPVTEPSPTTNIPDVAPASSGPPVAGRDENDAATIGPDRASAEPRDSADPTDRWIVVLKPGTDTLAARDRQGKRLGFRADRTYQHAFRGYAARMDPATV